MLAGMDALPTLDTPRLRLRQLTHDDVPAVFAVFSDPRVMRFWSSDPLPDLDAARALVDDVDALRAADSLYQWGVEGRDDRMLIGTATLSRLDFSHRRAELGFALRSDRWGRGYATEAAARLARHAFDDLAMHRLEADVDPRNEASLAVLAKLGFEREGYAPHRWFVAGEWADSVLLGLLATRRPA